MTQAHLLDKIHSENYFRDKKANKDYLEYFFQDSPSNFFVLFLGVIKNHSINFSTKFSILGKIFANTFFEIFKNTFWDPLKKR